MIVDRYYIVREAWKIQLSVWMRWYAKRSKQSNKESNIARQPLHNANASSNQQMWNKRTMNRWLWLTKVLAVDVSQINGKQSRNRRNKKRPSKEEYNQYQVGRILKEDKLIVLSPQSSTVLMLFSFLLWSLSIYICLIKYLRILMNHMFVTNISMLCHVLLRRLSQRYDRY